jgi:hypothetical protein
MEGSDMHTLIFAYVIAVLGLIIIGGGIWLLFDLFRQTVRPPLRHYWRAVGMICGGFAMVGLAQALRLLVDILAIAQYSATAH